MESPSQETVLAKFTVINLARFTIMFIVAIFMYFTPERHLFIIISVFALLSLLWFILTEVTIIDENKHYVLSSLIPTFLDVSIITLLIYYTGSLRSFGISGYVYTVALCSMNLKFNQGLYSWVLSSLLFFLMGLFIYLKILPSIHIYSISEDISLNLLIVASLTNVIILYSIHKIVRRQMQNNHGLMNDIHDKNIKLQIRNQKMEDDLTLARNIQSNLIPKNYPSKHIASVYIPVEQVGGDFFDFISFEDSKKIGIFLSDVSGHGVAAAFITSMIKTIILQSGEKKNDPAELLFYLNEVLLTQTANNFVTCFYGIFDPIDRSLYFSNAGHNQPYVISKDDVSQLEGGKNSAIALFPSLEQKSFESKKIILPENSKLLLYTDGLIEARPVGGDKLYEYAQIEETFIGHHGFSCKKFLDNIMKDLVVYRKSDKFEDDICLICLDVK